MRASIYLIPKWPYFSILLFTCTCKLACVALFKGKYSFEFGERGNKGYFARKQNRILKLQPFWNKVYYTVDVEG